MATSVIRLFIIALVGFNLTVLDVAAAGSKKLDPLLEEAGNYFRLNQLDKAYPLFRKYLKKHPADGNARASLAWIIFQSRFGNPKAVPEAMKEAELAVKQAPKSPLTHNVLGAIYFAQGRVPDAQKEFRTVLAIDPKRKCGGCGDVGALLFAGTKYDNTVKVEHHPPKKNPRKKVEPKIYHGKRPVSGLFNIDQ